MKWSISVVLVHDAQIMKLHVPNLHVKSRHVKIMKSLNQVENVLHAHRTIFQHWTSLNARNLTAVRNTRLERLELARSVQIKN